MRVFHVEFAKTGTSLSGGEKCMVEVIKYLISMGVYNTLLTTDNGKSLYESLGLLEGKYLKYIIIESFATENKHHIAVSYLLRLRLFLRIKSLIARDICYQDDVLMCHSDFFPNTIPTKLLAKYFKKKTVYWYHMLAPNLFKGYNGHFTGKFNFPDIKLIHYKFNQLLFHFLSRRSKIITINSYYKSLFYDRDVYVIKKFGGLENDHKIKRQSSTGSEKKYDLAFLGRFHEQKGLLDIPKILSYVKQYKPDVKLLVMGGGNDALKKSFLEEIQLLDLSENIECVGSISSDIKFDYLESSKIFIFPSHYESYGLVALEAMSCGLPVVAYNLPVYGVFKKGMLKVPLVNHKLFADEIVSMLSDDVYYAKLRVAAVNFSNTFSWEKTGEEVYGVINEL